MAGAASYEIAAYDQTDGHRTVGTVDHPTTTITDSDLVKGRTYYYWVRGINSDGGEGAWSGRALQVAGPAPSTPTGLTATGGYLKNAIAWEAVATAEHYEVWARLSIEPNIYRELDLNVSGTSYDHTGLTAGDQWYYWVRAVDSAGTMGLYAGPEITTVLAPPVLGMPSNLQAALGDTEITLTWGAPSSIPAGVTVTGYEYRYRESGGTWEDWKADVGDDRTETITGLTNGTAYDFEVRATTSVGVGNSDSRSRTPATVPGVTASFSATATHNSVTLSWGAPADDGGAQVSSYRIEFLNDQSVWITLRTLPASITSYTHGSRDRSTEYQYRIHAINAAGEGSAISTSILTAANAPEKPGPPQAISAVAVTLAAGGGKVDLSWSAPAFNGGSAITTYYYRSKEATETASYRGWINAGQKEDGSGPNTTVEGIETGLTPGTSYIFQVAARNAIAQGDPATSVSVEVLSTAPTAKPVISVRPGAETAAGTDQILINWDALRIADDGDSDDAVDIITSYTLQWKSSRDADPTEGVDTTDWPEYEGTDAEAVTANNNQVMTIPESEDDNSGGLFTRIHSMNATDSPLLPGATYTYRVRAVNTDETVVRGGPWSTERSSTTPANPPDAPGVTADNVNGTAPTGEGIDADTIEVSWAKPANDGGAAITSYELQVRTVAVGSEMPDLDAAAAFFEGDTGSTAQPANVADASGSTLITNLVKSRTSYVHDGVRTGVYYFYRVRAVNSAGKGAWSPGNANTEVGRITTMSAAMGTPGAPTFDATNAAMLGDDTTTVTFDWTAPGDEGEFPITSYQVQYQRIDDSYDGADEAAAAAAATADGVDWSDAISGQPTPPTNSEFDHLNAPGGSTFRYRVRAVNGNGAGPWAPAADSPDQQDLILAARGLGTPVLTATLTGMTDILLQWNVPASNGATLDSFDLQVWVPDDTENGGTWADIDRDDNSGNNDENNPLATDTLFTDSGLASGTKFYYRIRALGANGDNSSEWSSPDANTGNAPTATTPTGLPGRPTLTVPAAEANADAGTITLEWTAPDSTGGSALTGYEIQILDISTRTWVAEASLAVDEFTYTDEELEPGKAYYYILRAVNAVGPGPWTAFVTTTATTGLPDKPVLTATAASDTSIYLSWTVPKDNGTPIIGYHVQRTLGTPISWTNVEERTDTNTDTVTEDTDTGPEDGLEAGTKYFYRIRALTGDDDGSAYTAEDGSTKGAAYATTALGDVAVPGQLVLPTLGTATTSSVMLQWTALADTAIGGSAVTGYKVQVWDSASSQWTHVADVPVPPGTDTARTYTVTGLTAGETYYYRVAAVNSQGTGPYSEYRSAPTSIVGTVPDTPTLTATATGPKTIRLDWNVPADNGTVINGFEIQKWMLNDADQPVLGWQPVDVNPDIADDNNPHSDPDLLYRHRPHSGYEVRLPDPSHDSR